MLPFLTVLIVLVSVLLTAVILIQNPKGGGIDATFGGQAQQLFGAARSTDFVERATWVLIALLFALCIIAALSVGVTGPGPEGVEVPLQTEG
jgi:preprotein translocase subunit SecG